MYKRQAATAPAGEKDASASVASDVKASPAGPAPAGHKLEFEVWARLFLRGQSRANSTYGRTSNDEQWQVLQGARISTASRYGPVSLVVQLQDVREWGEGTSTVSNQPLAGAHQGYAEIADEGLGRRGKVSGFVRAGRQEVVLWTARLLANSPWQPGMRAFDAIRGRLEVGRFGVETGFAVVRAPRTFTLTDPTVPDPVRTQGEQLSWLELTARFHKAFEAHAAVLVLRQDATEADPARDRLLATPGVYFHGEPAKGWVYDVEGYAQVGRATSQDHRAWAGAATVGYTAPVRLEPGLRLTYELASGSACAGDPGGAAGCDASVSRDFEGHFGARHAYRGFADQVGASNFRDLAVRGTMRPVAGLQFLVDYHFFQLNEAEGQWVVNSGAPVGQGWLPGNDRNTIGHELDFLVTYKPWEVLQLRPGYSLFLPAGAGTSIAGSDPQHFAFLWLVAKIGHRWKLGSPS